MAADITLDAHSQDQAIEALAAGGDADVRPGARDGDGQVQSPPRRDPRAEERLEEDLKETFPASDPASINPGAD